MKFFLSFLSLLTFAIAAGGTAYSQSIIFSDSFDDGTLSKTPPWQFYLTPGCISADSSHSHSGLYACKVSTNSQKSAVETNSRVFSKDVPIEITEYVYVESMGDEAIPLLLHGSSTVAVLFLLPNGTVQLSILTQSTEWNPVNITVTGGWKPNTWQKFTIQYNGVSTTSLLIDDVNKGSAEQAWIESPTILQIGNMYIAHTSTFYVDDISVSTTADIPPPGTISFVLCSDTDTWDGLNVNTHSIHLTFDLFENPSRNAAVVIDPDFRNGIVDSYGHPLVFTWFMLDGSLEEFNTGTEVSDPWISNLEIMQKYHGETAAELGDEIAFHYHNWVWNDPDKNGVYYWNQSTNFDEYKGNFDETMYHLIVNGGVFPSSFRSGWHYMSNEWENHIDQYIPYRLENTSPDSAYDAVEPTDNIYDWKHAPRTWVPYHPDSSDYQTPGNLKGWETRCRYMGSLSVSTLLESFGAAFGGTNQVVTLWSHMAADDFPQQILKADSLIHVAADYFPTVKFEYATATRAMQHWRAIQDTIPPAISVSATDSSSSVTIDVSVDEPLWQTAPIVAYRTGDGIVSSLQPVSKGPLAWRYSFSKSLGSLQRIGIAATDTSGNVAVKVLDDHTLAVHSDQTTAPTSFSLDQNFPNPFNPSTTIRFSLDEPSSVRLDVMNVLGQMVGTIAQGNFSEGSHSVRWTPDLPSGLYFYRFTATSNINPSGNVILTRKAMLLK